jgi:hypothetical protein
MKSLKSLILLVVLALASLQMTGCATLMSGGECAAETMHPTVMAALDSFESAAMAIKLSNRVLMETPLSEQDQWPAKMFGAPSGAAMFKMGLAMAGSTQGVTIPTEVDKETGLPRPTSALYLFLKERDKMLDVEINKNDINFFKSNKNISTPLGTRKKEGTIDDNMYRNPLMAYGAVTGNNKEVLELQNELEAEAKGYKACSAFLRKTTEEVKDEKVKKANCRDMALKDDKAKAKLAVNQEEKKKDIAELEKKYGKLANKVYNASVSGADFTTAAMVKVACAIVNGVRALPNIKKEFEGVQGAYNVATITPRVKNAIGALGIYKDNLSLQFTVYYNMYKQIKGIGYELKDEEPTKKALLRIENSAIALAEIQQKLILAAAGKDVEFTDQEATRMNVLAAMYPAQPELEKALLIALNN